MLLAEDGAVKDGLHKEIVEDDHREVGVHHDRRARQGAVDIPAEVGMVSEAHV